MAYLIYGHTGMQRCTVVEGLHQCVMVCDSEDTWVCQDVWLCVSTLVYEDAWMDQAAKLSQVAWMIQETCVW